MQTPETSSPLIMLTKVAVVSLIGAEGRLLAFSKVVFPVRCALEG